MNLKLYLEERLAIFYLYGDEVQIFKNPPTLKNMQDKNIRGVLMHNGDLYVADSDNYVLHTDIIDWLKKQRIIKNFINSRLNQQASNITNFFCIMKDNDNNFLCGESYSNKFLEDNESIVLEYKELLKKRGYNLLLRTF